MTHARSFYWQRRGKLRRIAKARIITRPKKIIGDKNCQWLRDLSAQVSVINYLFIRDIQRWIIDR